MMIRSILFTALGCAVVASAQAGVKSLSSDEMVDTYIKDSAIIVVPRKLSPEEEAARQRKAATAITISPGESPVTDESKQAQVDKTQEGLEQQADNAISNAEDQFIKASLGLPQTSALAPPPPEVAAIGPPKFWGQDIQVPDAPFDISGFNDQVGLGYDGSQLTFSIGDPPGVDGINVPYPINEGPIQLTPRPGGGFDLVIDVPKN